MRRVRKDAIIEGLPAERRARVDKWLFDKGMSYGDVAAACGQEFGLKVSRSSVGRYHERRARKGLMERKKEMWTAQRAVPTTNEEGYERVIGCVTKMALELAEWVGLAGDYADKRELAGLMRILIAARRERNKRVLAWVERERFEIWAARRCLEHLLPDVVRTQFLKSNPAPTGKQVARTKAVLRDRLKSLQRFGSARTGLPLRVDFAPESKRQARAGWRWPMGGTFQQKVARTVEEARLRLDSMGEKHGIKRWERVARTEEEVRVRFA